MLDSGLTTNLVSGAKKSRSWEHERCLVLVEVSDLLGAFGVGDTGGSPLRNCEPWITKNTMLLLDTWRTLQIQI